ncbi:hypothetical protein M011DRAFT_457522 [Sporormia fimetaria CBS 119925]|uniref:Uncharacterized protein n=1 Tax=Sporormia fimetaria CBS 119925 TaxID=1340428 RepID=A0A6A6VDX5_9PLEO|nr:hypothetical protein M011DRAFT_457522 [Sporormia fimetaria CBS 119925]
MANSPGAPASQSSTSRAPVASSSNAAPFLAGWGPLGSSLAAIPLPENFSVPADVALLDAIEQEMAQQDPRAWAALEREELRLLGEKYTPGGIPPDKLQQHVKKFRLVYGSLSPGAIQKLGERLQSPQMAEGKILITPTKDGQVPAGLQSFTIPASQSGAHRPTALPQQYRVEPPSPGLRSLLTLTSWNKTAAPSAPPPSTTFSPGPGFPRLGSQPSKAAQFPTQTATSATAQYQNTPGVPAPTTSQPTLLDPLDFAAQVAARRVAENAELTASMEQQGRVIQIPYPGGPIKHNPFKTIPRAPPQKTTAPLSAFIAPRGKRVGRSYQGPLPSEADIYPDDSEFIASPERGESSSVLGQIERTPVALGQPGAFTFATPTPAQRKTTATLNVAAAPFTPAVPKADPITTQFGVPVTETDTSRTALPIPSSTQRINWLDPIHNFQPSTFTQQGSSTKGFGGQPSNIPGLGASSTTPWTTTGPQGVTTYPIGHTEGITALSTIREIYSQRQRPPAPPPAAPSQRTPTTPIPLRICGHLSPSAKAS